MIGYDLDGVLAEQPPPSNKPWGKMTGAERTNRKRALLDWYQNAKPLLTPTEPFIVISARKRSPDVYAATQDWLNRHHGERCLAAHLLNEPRSIENVVRFKSKIINTYNLTDFTEDNKQVLAGISKLNLPTRLWFWRNGMTEPIPYDEIKSVKK